MIALTECFRKIIVMVANITNQNAVIIVGQNKMFWLVDAWRFALKAIWALHTFKSKNFLSAWKSTRNINVSRY